MDQVFIDRGIKINRLFTSVLYLFNFLYENIFRHVVCLELKFNAIPFVVLLYLIAPSSPLSFYSQLTVDEWDNYSLFLNIIQLDLYKLNHFTQIWINNIHLFSVWKPLIFVVFKRWEILLFHFTFPKIMPVRTADSQTLQFLHPSRPKGIKANPGFVRA